MPRKQPLHYDKRRGSWVEQPKTFLQELNERSDEFHAGLIMGVGVGGLLFSLVMLLAFATHLF